MALEPLSGNFIDPETERPRSLQSSWFAVGRLVYGWTDRREAAVDKAWWQNQAPRFYMQKPRPDEASAAGVAAPSECPTLSQLLQPDLSEAKELLAGLASRSSCREHTLPIYSTSEDETMTPA